MQKVKNKWQYTGKYIEKYKQTFHLNLWWLTISDCKWSELLWVCGWFSECLVGHLIDYSGFTTLWYYIIPYARMTPALGWFKRNHKKKKRNSVHGYRGVSVEVPWVYRAQCSFFLPAGSGQCLLYRRRGWGSLLSVQLQTAMPTGARWQGPSALTTATESNTNTKKENRK